LLISAPMHALVLVAIANAASPVASDADVVELDKSTVVFARPRTDATKLGVIKKKARARVVGTAEIEDSQCSRWLEVAPRGWICENATSPTFEPPTAAAPSTLAALEDDGELAPIRATYGIVRRGTTAYSSREDIANGNARALEGSNTVRARGSTTIDGTRYWITTSGDLIDAKRVYHVRPSSFKGVAIPAGAQMPAWIHGKRDRYKPVTTYVAPGGKKLGTIPARTQVTILEASSDGRFVRVDDTSWIASTDVRIAQVSEPPPGTRADEKWFDIDLDKQILVAYEGARPVYATLVSTGKYGHFTPTLISRLASKHEATPMTSNKEDVYSVADVPWTMFYDGNYAIHTSYWHDGFGGPRSHGCINLAPRDARLLYAWSSPDVPPGWSSVYGSEEQPGSLVRVRSAKLPAPKLRGYAKAMHQSSVVANN
jgi:lipoprotein-anchoring transpeptidase ErfK/SrfK